MRNIDYTDCTRGLLAKPTRRDAILWYHLQPGEHMHPKAFHQFDNWSLHGGCNVHEGVKWAANKWIRNKQKPL
jgi:hypothetical protein